MRIIAGTLGGRVFDSPHSEKTHPMGDKIRGALFNILGDINDLTVLDAFAGSGALSFEAISRGALNAVAIESDRAAQATIDRNIASLNLNDKVKVVKATANAWLQTSDQTFDIVLLDPPYLDRQDSLVVRLAACAAQDGTVVVSWPGDIEPLEIAGFDCIIKRSYGDAQLLFYQRSSK